MLSFIKKIIIVLSMFLCLGPVSAGLAGAEEVELQEIVISNSSKELLLFLKVVNAFTDEVVKGVENGIPATFTFDVKVSLVREGWPNSTLASLSFDHTMVYDNLKKEYTVVQEEHGGKSFVTDKLDRAQIMMAELNSVRLIDLDKLFPDRKYLLEVRATLAKKTLPFYFHYLIPFGNFGNFDTDWYSVEFRY